MAGISAPVGLRGVNRKDDVRIVQELLNKVPHNLGGPLDSLNVDGLCGKKTNLAIEKLQAKQRGWNTVTSIIRPGDPIMKLLLTYDLSGFIDNTPAPIAPTPPPTPKASLSSFLITMAVKPGSQLDRENFYFTISDPSNSANRALYFMGAQPFPSLPSPLTWSLTRPPLTKTSIPMGVDDWTGDAVLKEKVVGGARQTRVIFMPTISNRIIQMEIHAHLNPPGNTDGGTTTMSTKLSLVDSSGTHAY